MIVTAPYGPHDPLAHLIDRRPELAPISLAAQVRVAVTENA